MRCEYQLGRNAAESSENVNNLWLMAVIANRVGADAFIALGVKVSKLGSSAGSTDATLAIDNNMIGVNQVILQKRR